MTGDRALSAALSAALRDDPSVRVLGEALELSVATAGLRAQAPERVHRMPASDAGLVGVAVGMAWAGARPVVELAGPEALWGAAQQLGQEAAASRGEFTAPVVVRVPMVPGAPDPSALLLGIQGLTVAAAGQPGEAAALLRAALRAQGPVVLLEPVEVLADSVQDLPELPLGRARVLREGAQVTTLAWGAGVRAALAAAEALAAEGLALEVVDLRTLAPLDLETVGGSVRKTGRVLLVGASGAALVGAVRAAFLRLEAPPAEVAADATAIAEAARAALAY